ncbi:MAG: hypothetical protein J0L99_20300 [Chitinophagales bacterium]|nr:hypothetical protein [Chitinophagales bacterium]
MIAALVGQGTQAKSAVREPLPPFSGRQSLGKQLSRVADLGGDTVVYCFVHKRFCFCSGQRCGGFQDQFKDKHTLLEQGKFERLIIEQHQH